MKEAINTLQLIFTAIGGYIGWFLGGFDGKEKKVALKEVMEGALVEYLMKYGFKREVETLLRNQ